MSKIKKNIYLFCTAILLLQCIYMYVPYLYTYIPIDNHSYNKINALPRAKLKTQIKNDLLKDAKYFSFQNKTSKCIKKCILKKEIKYLNLIVTYLQSQKNSL